MNAKKQLTRNVFNVLVMVMLLVITVISVNNVYAKEAQRATGEITVTGNAESNTISMEGVLLDSSGEPLAGDYDMVFKLYDAPSEGNMLWQESWTGENAVSVNDGIFYVMLGSFSPDLTEVVRDNPQIYLSITVGEDAEMDQRVPFGDVVNIGEETVTGASIVPGSIEQVHLSPDITLPSGVPVGTVITWWRFDESTPIPSDEWVIADGSVLDDSESPFDQQALPNLVDRFVMGTSPANIGQTGGNNTLNLSHNHSLPAHSHSSGSLYAQISVEDNRVFIRAYGSGFSATRANYTDATHNNSHITDNGTDVEGSTASWSGNTHQASITKDNRPAYVGLVYLIKVK